MRRNPLRYVTFGLAGLVGAGLIAFQTPLLATAAEDDVLKRDEDTAEVSVVSEDDDPDDGVEDKSRNDQNTKDKSRNGAQDQSRNTAGDNTRNTAPDQSRNGAPDQSRNTVQSRNTAQDQSRNTANDWSREDKTAKKDDWSRNNKSNDRSRDNTN